MFRNEDIISMAEAYKKMKEEELKGKQKELDLDDDGDIDGKDLKNLRKGKKYKDVGTDKVTINPKDKCDDGSEVSEAACKKSMKEEECPKCECDPCECEDEDDEDEMEEGSCSKKSMKKESACKKGMKEGENKQMKGEDPCWDDYEMVGHKMKDGKKVPNCVKKESVEELDEMKLGSERSIGALYDMIDRMEKILRPNGLLAKEVLSTRGAGFKKDFDTALKHVRAISDIVDNLEMELSMNESVDLEEKAKEGPTAAEQEKLEPKAKGEKKFKDLHKVLKQDDTSSTDK